jgi:hypothetical protein
MLSWLNLSLDNNRFIVYTIYEGIIMITVKELREQLEALERDSMGEMPLGFRDEYDNDWVLTHGILDENEDYVVLG